MMMQLATPGAPHQHLATLAGKWTTTHTTYMEEAPETSTGAYEGEVVLGGRYILGRFKGMMMGPMEIPSRSETVFVDKDTVQFTMWHTMGGQEMKAMEMTYKRAH